MAESIEVTVPDIGDFDEVEVIEVLVSAGQDVAVEDGLITLETDKAAMDIPSTHAGKIIDVKVNVGDNVSQGSVILTMSVEAAGESATTGGAESAASQDLQAGVSDETHTMPAVEASSAETVMVPSLVELTLPNLGDFDEVEVIEVLVSPGSSIEVDSPLVTLETDKATMDVPSTVAGTIKEVRVAVGEKISEGHLLALCESTTAPSPETKSAPSQSTAPSSAPEPTQVSAPKQHEPAPSAGAAPAVLPPIVEGTFKFAHASPAVRKFARELGVNLGSVKGSGLKSRISKDDVKAFVKSVMMRGGPAAAGAALPSVPKVDHAKYGEIELQPLTRIQKLSGPRLHASWVNIPHVTHNDVSDFTETEQLRKRMKSDPSIGDVKLTPLAFVLRACVLALEEMPIFNASLAEDGKALVMKKYINLGFAADTPNGLVVPVIHNAQDYNVIELAGFLGDLSLAAREGKIKATQMQGGTFTVSSLGGIGGTSFTPIINAPEVAILGVSRAQQQPVYQDGEFIPRLMLPLSLSYDHRVIDGASAARFTARLAQLMSETESLVES